MVCPACSYVHGVLRNESAHFWLVCAFWNWRSSLSCICCLSDEVMMMGLRRIWGYLITHIVVVVVVDDDYLCLMSLWWRIWGGVGLDHSHSCKMKRQQRKSSFNWDILTTISSSPKGSHEQHLTSFLVINHKKLGPNSNLQSQKNPKAMKKQAQKK